MRTKFTTEIKGRRITFEVMKIFTFNNTEMKSLYVTDADSGEVLDAYYPIRVCATKSEITERWMGVLTWIEAQDEIASGDITLSVESDIDLDNVEIETSIESRLSDVTVEQIRRFMDQDGYECFDEIDEIVIAKHVFDGAIDNVRSNGGNLDWGVSDMMNVYLNGEIGALTDSEFAEIEAKVLRLITTHEKKAAKAA